MEIILNSKYKLSPLLDVRKDDIQSLFIGKRGVFVCNYPEELWYEKNNLSRSTNYSIEKKTKLFNLLDTDAKILSPTQDSKIMKSTKGFESNRIVHFGSIFSGRLAQLSFFFQIFFRLAKSRNKYDFLLCYNFSPSEFLACALIKFLFNKKIYLDFEDDYLLVSKNILYKYYFDFVKRIPDKIICVNINMTKYFDSNKVYVFNGFISLDYNNSTVINTCKKIKFLYSGALDEIRGVDLIPELVYALREKKINFEINITGTGPLQNFVKSWEIPEVNYLGFLNSIEYQKIIMSSDICLVLQKPDHPFTNGSFPSKVEVYSEKKKSILHIQLV